MSKHERPTLSVGETAKRLGVSADTVRNYCERGLLQFARTGGNHRRILLRSIAALEKQRAPVETVPAVEKPRPQQPKVDEDIEIYYLGNKDHPNDIETGFICNLSYFQDSHDRTALSSVAQFLLRGFGGGTYRIARVREGFIVNERTISLPGPTKDFEMNVTRDVARGPDW